MKFLRKKILWYIVYGISITVVFLYLLFPGDLVKSKLENSANSADFNIKSSSLRASFPLGVKLKNVTLSSSAFEHGPFFQGESLDLQYSLLNLIRKNIYFGLSGRAYGGSFKGNTAVRSWERPYPPAAVRLNFKNVDLLKLSLVRNELGRQMSGKAQGSLNYNTDETGRISAGALKIFISDGAYPLAEPFLGINKIDFATGQIQAAFQEGGINLEKLELSGGQINCSLTGNIIPAANFTESRINFKGTVEIAGKDKIKMQVTIDGTLANPVFKYI